VPRGAARPRRQALTAILRGPGNATRGTPSRHPGSLPSIRTDPRRGSGT
jgi:hypothetical protein